MLLLGADMDDGLGLRVTTRPHGKTAAQLLQRVFSSTEVEALCEAAVRRGHVSVLQWLHNSTPKFHKVYAINDASTVKAAAAGGQVSVLKWLAGQRRCVSAFACCFVCDVISDAVVLLADTKIILRQRHAPKPLAAAGSMRSSICARSCDAIGNPSMC